jgi:uncharacterized membrane protein YkvA (DUF1232 family)
MTDTDQNNEPSLPEDYEEHGKHYNEQELWQKFRELPKNAAAQVMEKALLLRELLFNGSTPLWVRASIVGVLGYLILPLDLIPDPIPGVGFVDDVAAMALILASLDSLVTEDIRRRALKRMPAALREKSDEDEGDA